MHRILMHRADVAALSALAASQTVDHAWRGIRHSVESMDALPGALRWVDMPVLSFQWQDMPAYMTPTDCIGIATVGILLVRFTVWIARPLVSLLCNWIAK